MPNNLGVVGPSGLEPLTFPASRDALTLSCAVDELLDRTVRLPALDLTFSVSCRSEVLEEFLVDELPGASWPCIGTVASPVFGKPAVKVGSGPDIEFPRRNALQDVKMGHGRCRVVGPGGLEPLTFPASRDALTVVGPSGLEPLTSTVSR